MLTFSLPDDGPDATIQSWFLSPARRPSASPLQAADQHGSSGLLLWAPCPRSCHPPCSPLSSRSSSCLKQHDGFPLSRILSVASRAPYGPVLVFQPAPRLFQPTFDSLKALCSPRPQGLDTGSPLPPKSPSSDHLAFFFPSDLSSALLLSEKPF